MLKEKEAIRLKVYSKQHIIALLLGGPRDPVLGM